MKKLVGLSLAVIVLSSAFTIVSETTKYTVNNKISSIEWVGKKVTGSHNGTIAVKEGFVNVHDGSITEGQLTIDMSTIVVSDIKDAEMNGKLKGHLMSDDFFGVEKHPTAVLKINKVEKSDDGKHSILADLTIKGKTEKITIPATVKMEDKKVVVIGEVEIDRTKYGIKYGSGSFFDDLGDKAIYDNFSVKFKVGATS